MMETKRKRYLILSPLDMQDLFTAYLFEARDENLEDFKEKVRKTIHRIYGFNAVIVMFGEYKNDDIYIVYILKETKYEDGDSVSIRSLHEADFELFDFDLQVTESKDGRYIFK